MWNLSETVYYLYLVDRMYAWTKSTMNAEDLVVDYDAQSEEIEHVGEVVPDIRIAVFPCTFGVETVGLCNASRLVVASNQMHALGVSQFQTHK